MGKTMRSIGFCAALSLLGAAGAWADTLINFDDQTDGTNIDSVYAGLGVTFSNPAGGAIPDTNVYARSIPGFANSGDNVVSVFQTGLPDFRSFYGAVEATFTQAEGTVSIDAAAVAPFEFLGTPQNKPFIQAFNSSNQVVDTAYYSGTLPDTVGGVSPYETLTVTSAHDDIAYVVISTQQSQPGPPMYGLFDNLCFSGATNASSCSDRVSGVFYAAHTTGLPNPAGVPEPGSLALLVPGLAVLAGMKLRSKMSVRAL